ncbi:Hypothetical predicted protein [Octopus vulgaris]|uniref:Secreted protein n=1 Tax=Octopus vulgaris TaxID=6645 RepID=A0AA36AUJ7_OCTVU|nr:Hypothetical predicted protein [Octopus vulgaris]
MRLSIVFLLVLVTAHCQLSSCEGLDLKQTAAKIKESLEKGLGNKFKRFFHGIKEIFVERDGQFEIDGTPLVIIFKADDCDLKFGRKRSFLDWRCPADVTEIITNTKRHCERSSQVSAVQCATRMVLEEIQKNIELGKISSG